MSELRASFVARFGEDEATRLEDAAALHEQDGNDPFRSVDTDAEGHDPFADVLVVAIGFECVGRFAGYHGIVTLEEDIREWCIEHRALEDANLGRDWLSHLSGAYESWQVPS